MAGFSACGLCLAVFELMISGSQFGLEKTYIESNANNIVMFVTPFLYLTVYMNYVRNKHLILIILLFMYFFKKLYVNGGCYLQQNFLRKQNDSFCTFDDN